VLRVTEVSQSDRTGVRARENEGEYEKTAYTSTDGARGSRYGGLRVMNDDLGLKTEADEEPRFEG
jgi:hypothetical protein